MELLQQLTPSNSIIQQSLKLIPNLNDLCDQEKYVDYLHGFNCGG